MSPPHCRDRLIAPEPWPAGIPTSINHQMTDLLFGSVSENLLRRSFRPAAEIEFTEPWLALVWSGEFAAIPAGLDWEGSAELAHLIDGYALAEALGQVPTEFADRQLEAATHTGRWPGGAAELWASLFLEHRRWRASTPFEPDQGQTQLLDGLVAQLRQALAGECGR